MKKFNQKLATPLDFQKFFVKNIQKIKNGLRPSSVAFSDSFPPRGSLRMLPKKILQAKFNVGKRGRRVAADNFVNFFARKMSKDKA